MRIFIYLFPSFFIIENNLIIIASFLFITNITTFCLYYFLKARLTFLIFDYKFVITYKYLLIYSLNIKFMQISIKIDRLNLIASLSFNIFII